jgi:hypothetical protein
MDFFHHGSPGIGFEQLAGMVIGCILILSALRRLLFTNLHHWDWLLFMIYLGGIAFAGLRPVETIGIYQPGLLDINSLNKRDLVVNIAGFIPLGFLAMSAMAPNHVNRKKILRQSTVVLVFGSIVSLIIELIQHFWIPGRYSSIYDLITNTLGTAIGTMVYFILRKQSITLLVSNERNHKNISS